MILDKMKKEIKGKGISIVFTEGSDERILKASERLVNKNLSKPILVGPEAEIKEAAVKFDVSLEGIQIIDPATYDKFDEMVSTMVELRKGKQTPEQCEALLKGANYFGTMLVKMGIAHGLVGGATYSTADTVRPALQLVKTKPGAKTVSSSFVLYRGEEKYVMGDCAIIIDPSSSDIAEIAKESANTARVFGIDPKVALLSFSTKGSGKGPMVDKVVEAKKLLDEMETNFDYDGEFQFDAAVVPTVGQLKAPGSAVAGHANVFVFPSLEAGNIGYKIAQRLGGFSALGPILQGLNAPINDLSRGCNAEDVYELAIVTASQYLNR